MNAKETSEHLYDKHYAEIVEFDSGLSEEVIISILAIRHAIITATELSKHSINAAFWHDVITELEKL